MNENKVTLALHTDFLGALARLPRSVQNKALAFISKFRENPHASGLNLEKLSGCVDKKMYSVRIDATYRGIVVYQEETGVYLLLWVDHHDEAYRWASRKKCDVNPSTGVLQLYDLQNVCVPGESASSVAAGGASASETPAKPPLFADIAERDLLTLGVPEAQLDWVRSLPHAEALVAAKPHLAARAYEALSWLAEDVPVNEVIDYMESKADDGEETDVTASSEAAVGVQAGQTDGVQSVLATGVQSGLASNAHSGVATDATLGVTAGAMSGVVAGANAEDEALGQAESVGGEHPEPAVDPSENLALALTNPASLASFVVVEGEEELRQILAAPLEKWRVFLHPEQRKIVKRTFRGPARVLGSAGTGKTVVAMHRAKHLAAKCAPQERILFTTFTVNLAADIRDNLAKICSPEELEKIEVVNLDAWVSKCLSRLGSTATICYGDKLNSLWEEALSEATDDLGLPVSFYEEEWKRVVLTQKAFTEADYLQASRAGRGTRLDRKKRRAVWQVLDGYQRLMKEQGKRDINTAMIECRNLLARSRGPQYKHIIVDEGQDFGSSAYSLLRELAGEEHENDIFIVGDAHQRIYKNRATLYKCGINVRGRGRSYTLKINYRTTEEIRRYALALLQGLTFDDLDGLEDDNKHCQSLTHGVRPVVREFSTADKEADFLAEEIARLQAEGVPLNNICVVGRTSDVVERYYATLTARGLLCYMLRRDRQDERSHEGLRLATMHRVKGLEFRYVFVVAVNRGIVPLQGAIDYSDAVAERESLAAEKCLLYVALTRAQQGAYITSYGKSSEFLPEVAGPVDAK